MSTLNRCEFTGNLAEDLKVQEFKDGAVKVVKSRLAVNGDIPKEQADGTTVWEKHTYWVPFEAWGRLGVSASKNGKKGCPATIWGKLKTTEYVNEKYKNEAGEHKKDYNFAIVLEGINVYPKFPKKDGSETPDASYDENASGEEHQEPKEFNKF